MYLVPKVLDDLLYLLYIPVQLVLIFVLMHMDGLTMFGFCGCCFFCADRFDSDQPFPRRMLCFKCNFSPNPETFSFRNPLQSDLFTFRILWSLWNSCCNCIHSWLMLPCFGPWGSDHGGQGFDYIFSNPKWGARLNPQNPQNHRVARYSLYYHPETNSKFALENQWLEVGRWNSIIPLSKKMFLIYDFLFTFDGQDRALRILATKVGAPDFSQCQLRVGGIHKFNLRFRDFLKTRGSKLCFKMRISKTWSVWFVFCWKSLSYSYSCCTVDVPWWLWQFLWSLLNKLMFRFGLASSFHRLWTLLAVTWGRVDKVQWDEILLECHHPEIKS